MRKKNLLLVLALLSFFTEVKAQVIQGQVVNADQEPLVGVVVKLGDKECCYNRYRRSI